VLARRTLAVLLTVWALTEVSCLPERLHWFLHSLNLIEPGFLAARIVGYSLMASRLHQGGPEVEELWLPTDLGE
jgi:hypothetical protein